MQLDNFIAQEEYTPGTGKPQVRYTQVKIKSSKTIMYSGVECDYPCPAHAPSRYARGRSSWLATAASRPADPPVELRDSITHTLFFTVCKLKNHQEVLTDFYRVLKNINRERKENPTNQEKMRHLNQIH
jgi:hypothetical protein